MSWYAVFQDGDERPVALFRHRHQAEDFAASHAGDVRAGDCYVHWPARTDTLGSIDGLDRWRAR